MSRAQLRVGLAHSSQMAIVYEAWTVGSLSSTVTRPYSADQLHGPDKRSAGHTTRLRAYTSPTGRSRADQGVTRHCPPLPRARNPSSGADTAPYPSRGRTDGCTRPTHPRPLFRLASLLRCWNRDAIIRESFGRERRDTSIRSIRTFQCGHLVTTSLTGSEGQCDGRCVQTSGRKTNNQSHKAIPTELGVTTTSGRCRAQHDRSTEVPMVGLVYWFTRLASRSRCHSNAHGEYSEESHHRGDLRFGR